MEEKLNTLKQSVITASANPNFVHHKWFIRWHLEIVEKMSLELCDIYTDADRELVRGLVWIHDYAKILDFDREHDQEMMEKGRDLLTELNFPKDYVNKLFEYLVTFEGKMSVDLAQAPIEVRIVSSADAASHMVGPFYMLHWYENPQKSVDELLGANTNKLKKDWERKITLPEVHHTFENQRQAIKLLTGELPEKFFS